MGEWANVLHEFLHRATPEGGENNLYDKPKIPMEKCQGQGGSLSYRLFIGEYLDIA